MKNNPWQSVSLDDYENHMKLSEVYQLQTLDRLMAGQIGAYPVGSAAVLGVAGGNGIGNFLEHPEIRAIYGIDINPDYLAVSKSRFPQLGERYKTVLADINEEDCELPTVDLVMANLFVEYVGCGNFARAIGRMKPKWVSCVIQMDPAESFVSVSPYADKLEILDTVHATINPRELEEQLGGIGYEKIADTLTDLPNGKRFNRLDFARKTR